jgi:predicted CoA-binding protein
MSTDKNATLVIGASEHQDRYSNLAINRLQLAGKPVVALGKKKGTVHNVEILTGEPSLDNIDTVTLYINPTIQKKYYDYILSLKPRRIIFNPGAENPELAALAQENNIQPQNACTLVLLSTRQY